MNITYNNKEFKEIPYTDGKYFASVCGLIYSKKINNIKKQRLINSNYLVTDLWFCNKYKTVTVHSLVALTYIGDRPNGFDVNHIDFNRLNNSVSNLEYISRRENIIHSLPNRKMVPIYAYTSDGVFVGKYDNLTFASKATKVPIPHIIRTIKDQTFTSRRYFFSKKYKESYEKRIVGKATPVSMYTLDMVFIRDFSSIKEACSVTNSRSAGIVSCCVGRSSQSNGFFWKYKNSL